MGQKQYYEEYFDQFSETSDDRTRQRIRLVASSLEGKKGALLQVSCGNGLETALIRGLGDFEVTAVDISERALAAASERGAKTLQLDIERESLEEVFDFIVCFEVLEHLVNPREVLERLAGNLSDNGVLILSLPNEFHLIRRLQFLFGKFEFAHYDWHHLRFFTYREAKRLARDSGFEIVGETFTSLFPPRMKGIAAMAQLLAPLLPSLFAFSFVLILKCKTELSDRPKVAN